MSRLTKKWNIINGSRRQRMAAIKEAGITKQYKSRPEWRTKHDVPRSVRLPYIQWLHRGNLISWVQPRRTKAMNQIIRAMGGKRGYIKDGVLHHGVDNRDTRRVTKPIMEKLIRGGYVKNEGDRYVEPDEAMISLIIRHESITPFGDISHHEYFAHKLYAPPDRWHNYDYMDK